MSAFDVLRSFAEASSMRDDWPVGGGITYGHAREVLAEVGRLTALLQEEQDESLRQAEIARDALTEVERLGMAWNEASANKHRLLKEVRALEAEVEWLTPSEASLLAACQQLLRVRQHPFGDPYTEDVDAAVEAARIAVYRAVGHDAFRVAYGEGSAEDTREALATLEGGAT